MSRPKLHLDADASQKSLLEALLKCGHDVSRTPRPGLPLDADDDFQLLWATSQGRIIFTQNIRDFIQKTEDFPNHAGILLAHRSSYNLFDLIRLLDLVLTDSVAEEWIDQVCWLSELRTAVRRVVGYGLTEMLRWQRTPPQHDRLGL